MPIFPKSELIERGRSFIEENSERAQQIVIPIHHINEVTSGKNFDGSPRQNILSVEMLEGSQPSSCYLDAPLFSYSSDSGTITLANNPIVNARDCSIDMLVSLGNGILDERFSAVDEIRDLMIRKIGATLFAAATPRLLMSDLADEIEFICKDNAQPNVYMSTARLLFGSIIKRQMVAFDVHDITQHAAQVVLWPDAARDIATAGFKAFSAPDDTLDDELLFRRSISAFAWSTGYEESILNRDGELISFGCLNWLAPGDTPADFIPPIGTMPLDEQRIAHRWHYLDSIKDLYRKQYRHSEELGINFDWMSELGYEGNARFTELCRSADPLPFVSLDFYEADKLEVTAPSTPKELLYNAVQLLKRYDLLPRNTGIV